MKVEVTTGDIVEFPTDAVVVNMFEGLERLGGTILAVDQALDGAISQLIGQGEINGKLGEVTIVHSLGKLPAYRVAVVGLGKREDFTLDIIRRAVGEAFRALRKIGVKKVATVVHGAGVDGIEAADAVQAIAEGCLLGLYNFRKYLSKQSPENGEVEEVNIVERDVTRVPVLEEACQKGVVVAEAAILARDMANEPANYMTPADMAEMARNLAKTYGLEVIVLEREEMEKMGMGALLGVACGSQHPPKFIVLRYTGDSSSSETMGFIGKGITFDSGGISIKPSEGMGEMKDDMAGGAVVIAAVTAISRLRLKVNVAAIVGATENLPSGSALKPGDVLKAMNGKTIEIISTDAEGRLTLADALTYAVERGFSPLIDVATLTGACVVALGDVTTGVFGTDQELVDKVLRAAEKAGERMWQMPMFEEYKEMNKSDVADIKNAGGRKGGAITAAKFLAEFSGDRPWVHLDIAGTSFADRISGYNVKGATGVAVRTLVNLALSEAIE